MNKLIITFLSVNHVLYLNLSLGKDFPYLCPFAPIIVDNDCSYQ